MHRRGVGAEIRSGDDNGEVGGVGGAVKGRRGRVDGAPVDLGHGGVCRIQCTISKLTTRGAKQESAGAQGMPARSGQVTVKRSKAGRLTGVGIAVLDRRLALVRHRQPHVLALAGRDDAAAQPSTGCTHTHTPRNR